MLHIIMFYYMKGGKMKKILFVLALLLVLGVTNAYAWCKYIWVDGKAVWVCDYNE